MEQPLWVLALQKKSDSFKKRIGLIPSGAFGAVKPVTKFVTKTVTGHVTKPLETEKVQFGLISMLFGSPFLGSKNKEIDPEKNCSQTC